MENNPSSILCPDDRMAVLVEAMQSSDESALHALNNALERWPDDYRLWFLRGAVHAGSQHYEAARNDFGVSQRLTPDFPIAGFMLGFLHLTHGHVDRAVEAWGPLDALSADDTLRVLKTGLLNLVNDRFALASEQLRAGIASNTKYPLINRYIVDVLQHVESIVGATPASHAPSEKTGILPEIDSAYSTPR
ncbi:TPA: tetratricopeptide repeat protein [Burkholderia vietnamiensis]|uniref:tetratricopeptide repeat protein n=1 Tax=Burkholderia vietnamiensis TaxID=60552 RepID=UPI00158C3A0A|nr:tetratricopeptide repeat protein [Burkholderia vietnamiensis]HDR9258759.1 tetratricopeptide repeat protein [Burkholderia vietnamiensis]